MLRERGEREKILTTTPLKTAGQALTKVHTCTCGTGAGSAGEGKTFFY
jgi:hypothetical protein